MNYTIVNGELYHHGVKGMRWGVRKDYKSTGIRSALARRANRKVDASFKKWNDNVQLRDTAIELGKKAVSARLAYENDPSNKTLKKAYKEANKEYKKALSKNTAYRKGVVRQEVGREASKKYLSDAKKVRKKLDADPNNKELQKQYNDLMSKHDVERAKARRAGEVGTRRSNVKASLKRTMTCTVKAAATTAAVGAGVYYANKFLRERNVTFKGRQVGISGRDVDAFSFIVNKGRKIFSLVY